VSFSQLKSDIGHFGDEHKSPDEKPAFITYCSLARRRALPQYIRK
jgi:hypothetical protein